MHMKSTIALMVMLASPSLMANANAQTAYPQAQNQSYFAWCDQVEVILNNSTRLANSLYGQTKFAEAKRVMVNAFQQALSSTGLPGGFRPNTYKELVRTLDLVRTLEASPIANPTLKNKMIAYVALNRVGFVLEVKNKLDRPFTIPCRSGCGNGYGNRVNMNQYEYALASVARSQLQIAQKYSTQVIPNRNIQVYPLVDSQTYFTIISKAAQWAAEDLSMTLFGQTFSCAIMELQSLGFEAASMAATAGEVYAVQYIHDKVDVLKSSLGHAPYGCGGVNYPDYDDYDHY